jgi:hypothetical protein
MKLPLNQDWPWQLAKCPLRVEADMRLSGEDAAFDPNRK